MKKTHRGFALLVAVIFMSVMLALGLSLASLGYKQQILASSALASQNAFYAADSGLECILYYDQQLNFFGYTSARIASSSPYAPVMFCRGVAPVSATVLSHDENRWVVATRISYHQGTHCADVTIDKPALGTTYVFSQGYDVPCATVDISGARFVSRGLSTHYTSSNTTVYATWNPGDLGSGDSLSEGNLTVNNSSVGWLTTPTRATIGKSAGKWYWEITVNTGTYIVAGISIGTSADSMLGENGVYGWGWYITYDGKIYHNSAGTSYSAVGGAGTVLGFALDMENGSPTEGTLTGYLNGASQGVIVSGIEVGGSNNGGGYDIYPAVDLYDVGASATANFGATSFTYTPPPGFSGLFQ